MSRRALIITAIAAARARMHRPPITKRGLAPLMREPKMQSIT